jgi:hypothetical protein
VLKKIGIKLTQKEIEDIINYKPMAIENLLKHLHPKVHKRLKKIQQYLINRSNSDISDTSKINTTSNHGNKNLNTNLENSNNNVNINNKIKFLK